MKRWRLTTCDDLYGYGGEHQRWPLWSPQLVHHLLLFPSGVLRGRNLFCHQIDLFFSPFVSSSSIGLELRLVFFFFFHLLGKFRFERSKHQCRRGVLFQGQSREITRQFFTHSYRPLPFRSSTRGPGGAGGGPHRR